MTLSPADALRAAQRLLDTPSDATAGAWARAVAILTRQEIERAMRSLWAKRAPSLVNARMGPQLIALPRYLDDDRLAADVVHTWHALTRACHHRAYELPPPADELRRHIHVAMRFLVAQHGI